MLLYDTLAEIDTQQIKEKTSCTVGIMGQRKMRLPTSFKDFQNGSFGNDSYNV